HWRCAKTVAGEYAGHPGALGERHEEQVLATGFADARLGNAELDPRNRMEVFGQGGTEIDGHSRSCLRGLRSLRRAGGGLAQLSVAVLVLLSRAAGTGIVAADLSHLAHERRRARGLRRFALGPGERLLVAGVLVLHVLDRGSLDHLL